MGQTFTFNWDNLNSSTSIKYGKVLSDTVFQSNILLKELLSKGKTYDGGRYISVPLEVGTHSVYNTMGWDSFNIIQPSILDSAVFTPSSYNVPISINEAQFLANNGSVKILDLFETLHSNARKSLESQVTTDLFVATTADVQKFWSLNDLIAENPTADPAIGSIGGITRVGNTFWQNQYLDFNGIGSIGDFNYTHIQDMFSRCTDGADMPKIIVTTDAVWNQVFASLYGKMHVIPNKKAQDLGVPSIDFNGVPIIADKNCTSGSMYFINSDYLYLDLHINDKFKVSPWIMLANQRAQVKRLTLTGQMISSNPRRQGVIFNID